MSQITTTFRNTILLFMVISGAINTIAYKFQNTQYVFQGSYYKFYFHPYMQATSMFVGQAMAMLVYLAMKKRDPQGFKMRMLQAKSQGKQVKMNYFLLAIPAASDLITSTMQYIALNFVPGSVYQMIRGGSIVTTFILSIFFLKMKVQRHMVAGATMALVGVFVVGLSNIVFSKSSDSGQSSGLQIFGYILLLGSLFTNGFLFIYEQKLLTKYHLQPLQVVGFQGIFGICYQIILLSIFSFVPCGFGPDACVLNYAGMPFIQSPSQYFTGMASNGALIFFVILGIFSIATFNVSGVTVTKYINALARSICDVVRTVIVWIVGIIVTVTAGVNKPNYEWQIIGVGAMLVQLLGFIILVLGNLVYNQIIRIPYLSKPKKQSISLYYVDPLITQDTITIDSSLMGDK